MELSALSSYFELVAGLNLGFAGFEGFRSAIQRDILTLSAPVTESITTKIRTAMSILETRSQDKTGNPEYRERAGQFVYEHGNRLKDLKKQEEDFRHFVTGTRSLFLAGGLYGMMVLLVIGFEGSFTSPRTSQMALLFSYLFFAGMFYQMSLSFIAERCGTSQRPLLVLLFILALGSIQIAAANNEVVYQYCSSGPLHAKSIYMALVCVSTPYVFLFSRGLYHKVKYRYLFLRLGEAVTVQDKVLSDYLDKATANPAAQWTQYPPIKGKWPALLSALGSLSESSSEVPSSRPTEEQTPTR